MNTVAWWLLAIVVILIGLDIFAAVRWGYQGTISYDVLTASKSHPIIALIVGIVIGHLFWPQ